MSDHTSDDKQKHTQETGLVKTQNSSISSITENSSQDQTTALTPHEEITKPAITEKGPKGDLANTIRDTRWLGMSELSKTFSNKKKEGINAYQIAGRLEKREQKRIKKRAWKEKK